MYSWCGKGFHAGCIHFVCTTCSNTERTRQTCASTWYSCIHPAWNIHSVIQTRV